MAFLTRPVTLGILWLVVIVYAIRFATLKLPAPPLYSDFNYYYSGALSLRHGRDPYLHEYGASVEVPRLDMGGLEQNQTPTLLLCFVPLSSLSPQTAYWIWIAVSFVFLAIAVWLILKETCLDSRQALLFAGLFYLYPAVYEHFYFANMQITILLLLVLAIRYLDHGEDRWAALALAFATALKAYPAILGFYLACRGRRRALLWMVIWGGVIGTPTLLLFGPAAFSFLHTFGYTTSRQTLETPGFLSISSFVSRLFWRNGAVLSALADRIRRATVLVVELVVLALTASATLGSRMDRGWRAFSLWIPAMILLSPIGEPHYLVMLLVPFACIADAAARGEAAPSTICMAVASYLIAFARYPLTLLTRYNLGSATFLRIAGQFWFVSLVLMYAALYRLVIAARAADAAVPLESGAALNTSAH